MKIRGIPMMVTVLAAMLTATIAAGDAQAITCGREVTANIVALDQPVMFNRLGASNVNGMIFALERDVVLKNAVGVFPALTPIQETGLGPDALAGNVQLRPDKRPRPLVLRIRKDDCLSVTLKNLLAPAPNPGVNPGVPDFGGVPIDDQVLDRYVSFHVSGMQYVNGPGRDDGAYAGANANSTVAQGTSNASAPQVLYAEREGTFTVMSLATTVGSDANQGNSSNLLFGQVIVEPAGSAIYRGQVTEEEMRLVSTDLDPASLNCGTQNLISQTGHPKLDYEARYPAGNCNDIAAGGTGVDLGAAAWTAEGKAGLPILNMMLPTDSFTGTVPNVEIVHSEINAVVAYGPAGAMAAPTGGPYSGKMGHFPPSTYPLEGLAGKRNPTVPNRLEPFRDFASIFHDEPATKQAFPMWYDDRTQPTAGQFRYVLAGVKDGFMINYGSGGIGSEIIANRLRVGPMHDCLTCAYEEFFLTSFTVGDPATLVDIPANIGLESCNPSLANCEATGPKATKGLYTEDPANIHHSYTGDFAKIRNVHIGKEQHVFHLHNHQWLYNPNDDNANYLDAQGIGPGVGYTYEINFGGSGNRNKSSGDSIFHCHFYPHFAQGMWYHWRHHDVFESGTLLAVTPNDGSGNPTGFHAPFDGGLGLGDGTPAQIGMTNDVPPRPMYARALPDGEVTVGVPIPAVVPLPGKPMAPMPGKVAIVPNTNTVCVGPAPTFGLDAPGCAPRPTGSLAMVVERPTATESNGTTTLTGKNPGYPFWIAGIEDLVGQRPPTPVLDMVNPATAGSLNTKFDVVVKDAKNNTIGTVANLFGDLKPDQADGWDGGLPRGALEGYAAGGHSLDVNTAIDFSKMVEEAQGVFYPEDGTDLEKIAMGYHAIRNHPTCLPDGTCDSAATPVNFVLNGQKPAVGAPYHEPCIDDNGARLGANVTGKFFGPELKQMLDAAGMTVSGSSLFTADAPRIYKGAQIQYDAVFNKVGYHYPQQRIISLWEDAVPVITKQKIGQPLVMRFNTFDCGVYHHTNLTPEVYEVDDYQVRTPTDIIGQHIHLPKWDLTTTDGAANGWNYEDGTLAAGAVRERIHALNEFLLTPGRVHKAGIGSPAGFLPPGALSAAEHPYFNGVAPPELQPLWIGARTTTQRWFIDPVVNTEKVDRGLGIIFTHDHYGPSTHQQIGLYATVLTEPAGSHWAHNETGEQVGCRTPGQRPAAPGAPGPCRHDGGPTAWQVAILPQPNAPAGASTLEPFREFYFEYSDFQHAYEAGVYVGTGQLGEPLPGTGAGLGPVVANAGNPDFDGNPANAFRFAINPPAREQIVPAFPELAMELASTAGQPVDFCPQRPCPQAIDVQDPGMHVVNYRNEPVGLRIYDPNRIGPDGKPGMQAEGPAGDLAFALVSLGTDPAGKPVVADSAGNPILRRIPELNVQPVAGTTINGTVFPPPVNSLSALVPGDPFTPMLRTFAGDLIRVKMQAGGHEEEHNATIHGVKWLQGGSGHGTAGNSGWRNAQAGGISEQFTLKMPVVPVQGQGGATDYVYSMDASNDGWWSGTWGIIRSYNNNRNDLFMLPTTIAPVNIANANNFNGICPKTVNGTNNGPPTPIRSYDITVALANDILPSNPDVTIQDLSPVEPVTGFPTDHVGNWALDPAGGTLVYNPRIATVTGDGFDPATGLPAVLTHAGPIHDPTAILYVRTSDIDPATGKLFSNVKVEPLVLRAAAGDCIEVTLRNALPPFLAVPALDALGNPIPVIDPATGLQAIDPVTGQPLFATVPESVTPDLATYSMVQGVVKRDRGIAGGVVPDPLAGSTTFQANLFRPSGYAGIHPQLVFYDVTSGDGTLVGLNPNGLGKSGVIDPATVGKIQWYAGDITPVRVPQGKNNFRFQLVPTPVEFGAVNLSPADKVKQGAKGLVGTLVIEPKGSTWNEDTDDANGRQTATVTAPGQPVFRDFSAVFAKAATHYYADSSPVEHINGEGVGIPEDSQEASGMAVNYGVEPLWFRAGILPQSDFGPLGFGGLQQFDLFSNAPGGVPIGDPATPVFSTQNRPFRIRVTNPFGTSRGTTFQLHGHLWPRDPYVCPGTKDGIAGRCATNVVGSQMIGNNRQSFFQGGQESITPATHFDIVPTQPGSPGDYLFRDTASFGSASGVWGIIRVP